MLAQHPFFLFGKVGEFERQREVRSMEKETVKIKAELSSREWQLLQLIRQLDYGQLTITVKASAPIHVEEVRKSIPLK